MKRRSFLGKLGIAGIGASYAIPVAKGKTASGSVEVEAVASIPSNTSISITLYEDLTGDGIASNIQTKALEDGTHTYVYEDIDGTDSDLDAYWIEVAMQTNDTSVTPSLDSVRITLPEKQEETSTLPWYESRGESLLRPTRATPRISLFLGMLYGVVGIFAFSLRNYVGILAMGLSLISLLFSILLGLDLTYAYIMLIFAVLSMALGKAGTFWEGVTA